MTDMAYTKIRPTDAKSGQKNGSQYHKVVEWRNIGSSVGIAS